MMLNLFAMRVGQSAARATKWAAIGAAFCLLAFAAANAELVDRIAAVVNDDIILESEVVQALDAFKLSLGQQGYTPNQQRQILTEQRSRVVAQMIDDKLTDQQVRRFNIEIEDKEVEMTIDRIQEANQISDDELRRALDMSGTSYADYKRQIKTKILRARLLNREVKSKIVITDSEVTAYYEANKARYAGSTKYDLQHILMRVAPSDESVKRMQIRQQMEAIHRRLEQGEAFDKLAGLYSSAATASKGGRLGVFSEKSLTDQVRDALAGLEEKQFTEVLDTEQGYQIFYIEKIVRSGGRTIDEVKPEIQQKLYADIVDREFQAWLERLRQNSHIQIME